MKPRLHIRLSPGIEAELEQAALRPGMSRSLSIERALAKMLLLDSDGKAATQLQRRLDQIGRGQERLARDLTILSETFALFLRMYLMATTPLTGADQASAKVLGAKRFEAFVAQLGRNLSCGTSISDAVLTHLGTDADDLWGTVDFDPVAVRIQKPVNPPMQNGEASHG